MRILGLFILAASLAACQPPQQAGAPQADEARDNAAQRISLDDATGGPSTPITSPDTAAAVWSPYEDDRLLFGNVGEKPFLSLECILGMEDDNRIRIVRHMAADAEAQALFAFVGNGTIDRIEMDAAWRGDRWRWEGDVPADSTQLEAITGARALYATLPGGGRLELPASTAPGRFVTDCQSARPL